MNSTEWRKATALQFIALEFTIIVIIISLALFSGCAQTFNATDTVVSQDTRELTITEGLPLGDFNAGVNIVPAEMTIGTIKSIGNHQFVVLDRSDQYHTFKVNDDTKYTLDGNEAIFDQLKVDYHVAVTARDNNIATSVDATRHD